MKDSGRKFCKHMIHLLNCRKSFFSSGLYERSYEPKKLLIQLLANACATAAAWENNTPEKMTFSELATSTKDVSYLIH